MKELRALTTVYSYMFPEIKNAIFDTFVPDISNPFKGFQEGFLSKITANPDVMDNMHIPIMNKWVNQHRDILSGIDDFKYIYPTAGSEESIREFMTYLLSKGLKKIYVLKGEYEGYKEVGKTRSFSVEEIKKYYEPSFARIVNTKKYMIETIEIEEDQIDKVEPGWFFISNPSARNGNIIPDSIIYNICNSGHKVFIDLAYIDSVDNEFKKYDIMHPNIKAITFSFSKPYGLFYFRFGGLLTKEEVPSLYGNKWFKVVPSLLIADKIMNTINPDTLVKKYKNIQLSVVKKLQEEYGIPFKCSDVIILSHLTSNDTKNLSKEQLEIINKFKRGDGYRFCLKPYFEELEISI